MRYYGCKSKLLDFLGDGVSKTEAEMPSYEITAEKIQENYFYIPQAKENHIQLHN
ncbi:MAG: hypothetical protein HY753_06850, partial [Nitrospirae bacterium]|nr:hypothetical protein [Nitrospirota bacterium]